MSVIDFCDFEFKEVGSLFKEIEEFLNVDMRLACNKLKPPSRDIEKVKQEIMSTRKKFDFYQNDLPDNFPDNDNLFKFLGLMTN